MCVCACAYVTVFAWAWETYVLTSGRRSPRSLIVFDTKLHLCTSPQIALPALKGREKTTCNQWIFISELLKELLSVYTTYLPYVWVHLCVCVCLTEIKSECLGGFELPRQQAVLGRRPDTSVIQTDVKERNAVLLAVITPLCNPVSSSRLHTLILRESVRETGKSEREGRQTDSKWVNGIIIWETERGRRGTTGTCVWTPASGVPCVYQCVNTELTVRQPKTVEKRVEVKMGSKVTV